MTQSDINSYLRELSHHLLVNPLRRRRILAEAKDHLIRVVDKAIAAGADPEEARAIAILRFGDPKQVAARFLEGDMSRTAGPRTSAIHSTAAYSLSKRSSATHFAAGNRGRRYPPLLLLALGTFLTATILPSALNLTLPNPSQTLEYAPVPSDGDKSTSGGSLSSLGLGHKRHHIVPLEREE